MRAIVDDPDARITGRSFGYDAVSPPSPIA